MYPYNQSYPSMYNNAYNMNSNILPQQQVTQVNGKASADSIQLAPNSSILVMDNTAPMVWLCTSDGVGKTTAVGYDITLHKEEPPINYTEINSRLTKLENMIAEMGGRQNGRESNAGFNKQAKNVSDERRS